MISRLKLLFVSVILHFFSLAQKDSVVFIQGTHCSMVPPVGFVAADRFTGFQNNSTGATILVTEIPEVYARIIPGITPDALLKQKVVVDTMEKIQFNGAEATIINARQTQNGIDFEKIMLIFGSGKNTVLVNGIYPVTHKNELAAEIRKAMFTTIYNESSFEDAKSIFEINTEGTAFKKVKNVALSSVYSTDSLGTPDAPTFILTNSVDKVSKENRLSYAESRIMNLPRGDHNKILTTKAITLDGLEGYEIIAEGKSATGSAQLVYQVIVYNDQGDYYIMVGYASKSKDQHLATFRKLAGTFKLRKS